ncbi:MAG TPA: polysaccharide biosynthesis tyrosine autokinase [Arcobacter sp.]|nr:polysaccharide biosynthesis tyrosine autokinase [Arcobacter sp.]
MKTQELTLNDIYQTIKEYKIFIIVITLISLLLSYTYIYFKPATYSSFAIIKVKPNVTQSDDLINNTTETSLSTNVSEETTLLKTFHINSSVLNKINFKVQYFKNKDFKDIELYKNSPIKVTNIKQLNPEILNKTLTLIPKTNGFQITYENSLKNKLKNKLFKTPIFQFKDQRIFQYDQEISNEYFNLTIQKTMPIQYPIKFIIHGSNREIFEKRIKNKLDISPLKKDTSLIKISFFDTIPERGKLYVNTLTDSFIEYSILTKNKHNANTLTFIKSELKNIKKELAESEKKLEQHQLSKNIVKPSIQGSIYINQLSQIDIQISENKLKSRLVSNLLDFVNNNYNLDSIAPSLNKLNEQNTLELITKLQEDLLKEEQLSLKFTDEYPELISIRKRINTLRDKITYNLESLRTATSYETKNLIKRKANFEKAMQSLPSKERELVNIKRNYEVKSRMYEYLLKKKAENKLIQLATFSDYQIIDYAYSTNAPIKPKRSLILLLSIILGLLIGIILSLIRSNKNQLIKTKKNLEDLTELQILSTIPLYKQKKHQIRVHTDVKSPFSDAFRTLRTNIQFQTKQNKSTSILVTSTIASEGKSTVSSNLATILQMAKYKVLIVSLDLRKPTLHKFFNVQNDIGISNYLNGDQDIDINDIIFTTEFANLDILPSGSVRNNPSELVLSNRLPKLLNQLKESYEYIIIDSAPIGIVEETKILMPYSDLTLFLVRERYAQKSFIQTIESLIEKHNFNHVGLILNASQDKGGEYGYGYSYEYK